MMRNEKSGGHSERSIGIGTIEVAVWDAVAKIAGKPLHALLAERYNGGKDQDKCFVYVGGGWYAPGKGIPELQDEMKRHLDAGYTMVKMKVGGAPLDEDIRRIEAVKSILPSHAELAVDANSKFDRSRGAALRQGDGAVHVCAGSRSRAIRSTTRRCRTSRTPIRMRSRPARTCSPRRTWKTWCASAT